MRSLLLRLARAVPLAAALGTTVAPALAAPLGAQRLTTPAAPAAPAPARLPTGAPGPGYWQQQVDYALEATLDPGARRLAGRGTVTYHNNSPDSLPELHWHLYQNIFRAGGQPGSIVGRAMTRTSGIAVTRVAVGGQALAPRVDGTLMRTPLPAPLAPGDSVRVEVAWTLEVPAIASLRTGSVGEDFGMAQWYPQVSTYDDVHGWNDLPYRGQGEFYLEYGNWDVRLTLPRRFLVAATGTLRNADAVLTPAQQGALRGVATRPVGALSRVVTEADTGGRGAPGGATRTWRFTAERVRDFAWAASPAFVWNATRTASLTARPEGVLIHSFYTLDRKAFYEPSWDVARRAIEFFSQRYGDYVYPQATVVSGPVEGMEYPMLAFEGVESRFLNMPEQVTVHELGHQWYPMMVGSNETRHAFMDEGFNTFIETEWFRAQYGRGGFWSPRMPAWARGVLGPGDHRRWMYTQALLLAPTVSLLVPADSIPEAELGAAAYQRPAAALIMLRDVVGDSTLSRALREYYARWLFRHPYPDDFFRTVENVAGRDLGWFWDAWFRQRGVLNLGVAGVTSSRAGAGWRAAVRLSNRGTITMPATVQLTLENGATRRVRAERELWRGRDTVAVLTVDGLPAPVRRAELDPDHVLLDAARPNNVWPAGAPTAAGPLLGVGVGGAVALVAVALAGALAVRVGGLLDGVRLSRFRPVRFAVGRFALWTRGVGVRPRRIRRPRLYGAGVLAVPTPEADLVRGTAYLTGAGPMWSLAGAVVLFPVVFLLQQRVDGGLRPNADYRIDSALFLTAVVLTLSFLRALLPRRARGAYLRDAPWVRLWARPGSAAAQRWSAVRALLAQSHDDVRPRHWNPAWVQLATAPADGSRAEAGACMLAYLWALDRGEAAEAADYLERARVAAGRRWWRYRLRRHIDAENAFYTTYVEGDAEAGWRLFRKWGVRRSPAHVRRRARAAVLVRRGELDKAAAVARDGLRSDARTAAWGGRGIATFERYWLAVLLAAADRRVGAAVVTPKPGSVGVLVG